LGCCERSDDGGLAAMRAVAALGVDAAMQERLYRGGAVYVLLGVVVRAAELQPRHAEAAVVALARLCGMSLPL